MVEEGIAEHKVRIYDTIDALDLRGRRATITYSRNGTFKKMSLNWPVIKNPSGPFRVSTNDDMISKKVLNALNDSELRKVDLETIESHVGYEIVNGIVSQVISLRGMFVDNINGYSKGYEENVNL